MSQRVIDRLKQAFGAQVLDSHSQHGDDTVVIERGALLDVCRFLRREPDLAFDLPVDVTAVDGLPLGWQPRFVVVYHLYSLAHRHRIRLKVPVSEADPVVDSVTSVWRGLNWAERETFDMFGIRFAGHPNLKRILLYDEFVGHPLRKDYPVRGYQPRIDMPKLRGEPVPGVTPLTEDL